MPPKVIHLVISLAPGGLERLVVDWTNARNKRYPGSTSICCLDSLGDLASQVEGKAVCCVNANRARWPFDGAAVKRIRGLFKDVTTDLSKPSNQPQPVVIHAHNLAAWQYGVLAKLWRTPLKNTAEGVPSVWGGCPHPPAVSLSNPPAVSLSNPPAVSLSNPPALSSGKKADGDIRPTQGANIAPFLVYTQHGANVHNLGMRDRLRARLLACFTDEIVTVSKATAEVMSKKLWIPRKRIKVVVNGVAAGKAPEARCLKPEVRIQLGIPEKALVIGTVGRLAYVKGHDRLLEAFAEGLRMHPTPVWGGCPHPPRSGHDQQADGDIRPTQVRQADEDIRPTSELRPELYLLLVGDGPERSVLEHKARELGIADRVIFAGYQAEPDSYLTQMDMFILPSRSEGLSVSLLEAMGAGVPVAVTDVGANREVIDDGKYGIILPEDEKQWPAILLGVFQNTPNAQFRAKAATTRVQAHYSLTATLDGYEALYGVGRISPLCVGRMSPSA